MEVFFAGRATADGTERRPGSPPSRQRQAHASIETEQEGTLMNIRLRRSKIMLTVQTIFGLPILFGFTISTLPVLLPLFLYRWTTSSKRPSL
jgi:hypothetical protein